MSLWERRRKPRQKLRVEAEYRVGDGQTVQAHATDLTSLGAFVATSHPPPSGTELVLRLKLDESEPIDLRGEVTWTRTRKNPGMGIRFDRITPDARKRLQNLVDR